MCFALVSVLIPAGAPALASTRVVPDQFPTIQEAINASAASDKVVVKPGVYRENLSIYDKNWLELIADSSATLENPVVIEALDPNSAVIGISTTIAPLVRGFTLRGATGNSAISFYRATDAIISNNIIELNQFGIGIWGKTNQKNQIFENVFRQNSDKDITSPANYDMDAGMRTKSQQNEIFRNDFYGACLDDQMSNYINFWTSRDPLRYVINGQEVVGLLGNYWANATVDDANNDGIADAPIISDGIVDNLPLVRPFNNYPLVPEEIITGNQEWAQNRDVNVRTVVTPGATLTIKSGATLNFTGPATIEVQGNLIVDGTKAAPVVFRRPDEYGRAFVFVKDFGSATITHADLSGGGRADHKLEGALWLTGMDARLNIQRSVIKNNAVGIKFENIRSANIQCNWSSINNNAVWDVYAFNPSGDPYPDFSNNWWGYPDGPKTGTDPERYGYEKIIPSMIFTDWLTSESELDNNCSIDSDCASNNCDSGQCIDTCSNYQKDEGEEGTDCGGVCKNVCSETRNPVLIVPGLLGTELFHNEEEIWLDIFKLAADSENNFMDVLSLDNNFFSINNISTGTVIASRGNTDYSQMIIEQLTSLAVGYKRDETLFTFPYDWRYGVSGQYPDKKTNVMQLKQKIDQILAQTGARKVDIVAHSLGGLIVKKYISDYEEPMVGKVIFVGVPNLGSPIAVKALLMGHDFNIFGLSQEEIREISQNMPGAYDLLPSQKYRTDGNLYLKTITNVNGVPQVHNLNFSESKSFLAERGLNSDALENSYKAHTVSGLDEFDVRTRGVDAYKIVGCASSMLMEIKAEQNSNGSFTYSPLAYVSSDDTVPFASADSVPTANEKAFYANRSAHGPMLGQDGIRQLIPNILAQTSLPTGDNIYSKSQLLNNPNWCYLNGLSVKIYSPVDITITDQFGNKVGYDENRNPISDIPGSSFEVVSDHKYVYLPTGNGESYSINLKGTGKGSFTLIQEKIQDNVVVSSNVFNDIPVNIGATGNLDISAGKPILKFDTNDDGIIETIPLTSELSAKQSLDIVSPVTSASIQGVAGQTNYYRSNVAVNLSAADYTQTEAEASGIGSINYSLDGGDFIVVRNASTTINIVTEGPHEVKFFAVDKLGNKEEQETISLVIDKTSPEINFSFDRIKKDLVFIATDNISSSADVVIVDYNGSVIATDLAGNQTKLVFYEADRVKLRHARVIGLFYNGVAANLRNVLVNFSWYYSPALPFGGYVSPNLVFLSQEARISLPAYKSMMAIFDSKKTIITEINSLSPIQKYFNGLKVVNFSTSHGEFKWSY